MDEGLGFRVLGSSTGCQKIYRGCQQPCAAIKRGLLNMDYLLFGKDEFTEACLSRFIYSKA